MTIFGLIFPSDRSFIICMHRVDASRFRTHSQNMAVAARQMAEKKTVGHLS